MADLCQNGDHRVDGKPYEIQDGGRRVVVPGLTVEWGAKDLRGDWSGGYVFCSFACLAAWASEKAAAHDGKVLVEGPKPDGDETA